MTVDTLTLPLFDLSPQIETGPSGGEQKPAEIIEVVHAHFEETSGNPSPPKSTGGDEARQSAGGVVQTICTPTTGGDEAHQSTVVTNATVGAAHLYQSPGPVPCSVCRVTRSTMYARIVDGRALFRCGPCGGGK